VTSCEVRLVECKTSTCRSRLPANALWAGTITAIVNAAGNSQRAQGRCGVRRLIGG
jgi:hypothetical protein